MNGIFEKIAAYFLFVSHYRFNVLHSTSHRKAHAIGSCLLSVASPECMLGCFWHAHVVLAFHMMTTIQVRHAPVSPLLLDTYVMLAFLVTSTVRVRHTTITPAFAFFQKIKHPITLLVFFCCFWHAHVVLAFHMMTTIQVRHAPVSPLLLDTYVMLAFLVTSTVRVRHTTITPAFAFFQKIKHPITLLVFFCCFWHAHVVLAFHMMATIQVRHAPVSPLLLNTYVMLAFLVTSTVLALRASISPLLIDTYVMLAFLVPFTVLALHASVISLILNTYVMLAFLAMDTITVPHTTITPCGSVLFITVRLAFIDPLTTLAIMASAVIVALVLVLSILEKCDVVYVNWHRKDIRG